MPIFHHVPTELGVKFKDVHYDTMVVIVIKIGSRHQWLYLGMDG